VKSTQVLSRKNTSLNNNIDSHSQDTTVIQLNRSVNAREYKLTLFSPAPLRPS